VTLRGRLGEAALEMTLLLGDGTAGCRQWIEVSGAVPPATTLVQRWLFTGGLAAPRLRWPAAPVQGTALATTPAAFTQETHCFAALIPDSETNLAGALRHLPDDGGGLEYAMPLDPAAEMHCLSSLLLLDARALPWRGFQQVTRLLAHHLPHAARPLAPLGSHGMLPPLPESGLRLAWRPFLLEGAPIEIAAHILQGLSLAAEGDWAVLDNALVWLDRLCLHQCLHAVPDGPPPGTVGDGPAWESLALWMPVLLLEAFRLSGIAEYALRGRAALAALPAEQAAQVYAYLYPRFGDLCVLPDFEEILTLADLGPVQPTFADRRIDLSLPRPMSRPLRVIIDGHADRYALAINQQSFGEIPTELLRLGFDVPVE
jgi:hypothetical protein